MQVPEGWNLSFNDHPTLKKVKLTAYKNAASEMRALKIKQLEEVVFCGTKYFNANDWKIFTANNPNIKSLTIKTVPLTTEGLLFIVSNLIHLEELQIKYNPKNGKVTKDDLRLILTNCKNIKKVDVVLDEDPLEPLALLEEFAEKLKNIEFKYKYASQCTTSDY